MSMPHSPLPWRMISDLGGVRVVDARNGRISRVSSSHFGGPEDHKAQAQYIVTACNAYPQLVAALRIARDLLERNGIERLEIEAALAAAGESR
jgi:hypothetical protein